MTLPADPRVLNGQYSYAMLQQPDGSQQIVLMENNSSGESVAYDTVSHAEYRLTVVLTLLSWVAIENP